MKRLFLPVCTALLGVIASVNIATAQNQSWISNGWGVGAFGGIGFAFGDISTESLSDAKYQLGVSVQKELVPYFDLKGNFMVGALAGEKAKYNNGTPAGLRFRSDYVTYNAMIKFHLTNYFIENDDAKFSAYLQAGVGMLHFKSVLYNSVKQPHRVESGTTSDITVPLGIGFEYRFTPAFSAALDLTGYITSATRLDVTKNETFRDIFFTPSIGVNYVFGKTQKAVQVPYQQVYTAPVVPVEEKVVEEVVEEIAVVEEDFETTGNTADDFDFNFDEPAVQTQPVASTPTQPAAPAKTREGLVYRVQISAMNYYNANTATNLKNKYNLSQVPFEEIDGGLYKYTIGGSRSLEEATAFKDTIVAKGVTDAFVVPYYVGKRITNQEAQALLQQ